MTGAHAFSSRDEALQTLREYVPRGRRIAAHSLVRSGKVSGLSNPQFRLDAHSDGFELTWANPPENEEELESLTARVRPCLLQSEPIYLGRVIAAILEVTEGQELTERQERALGQSVRWYEDHIVNKKPLRMLDQTEVDPDLTPSPGDDRYKSLTDVEMGLGWVYNDLVHASPRSDRRYVRKFPYGVRYQNGVVLTANAALTLVNLLGLVTDLNGTLGLGLEPDLWEERVVVGDEPISQRVEAAYVGPAGTVPPTDAELEDVPGLRRVAPRPDAPAGEE